jgi:predicted nuclease of predicted toxin-antitoxin system
MAREEGRILLTEDKDFGEAVLRHRSCNAVNLLRIGMVGRDLEWSRLQHAIERFGAELEERYTVVEVSRFRFRPLC